MASDQPEGSWYVLHLFTEQDKFLVRYRGLSGATQALVAELLYFTKPDKALYERESGGVFAGYVFARLQPSHVRQFHRALRQAGLGEVLGYAEGMAQPLDTAEIARVMDAMRSCAAPRFAPGTRVRILHGPYSGMEGEVTNLVGQTVTVRVPLRRSISYAEVSLENLEDAA